jgi:branched-chain amino acid transport system substrate-binding protein
LSRSPAAPLASLAALAVSLGLLGCPADGRKHLVKRARDEGVVIGAVLPLTGPRASYGVAVKSGIDLAVLEANDSGGVLGKPVRVRYVDARGNKDRAKKAAEDAIVQHGAKLLIGGVSSDSAMGIAAVAERAKTPMISPSATARELTASGSYVFRICFTDPFQGTAMALHARDSLKLKRIAVLRDVGSTYSVRLADAMTKTFEARGGEVVASATFEARDEDVRPMLQDLLAPDPEAIYIPGYEREVLRIVRTARALGFEGRFLGADGWDTEEVRRASDALEGARFTTHFASDEPRATVTAFSERFVAKMNEAPNALSALGYDAARVALLAIGRAGSDDRERIHEALRSGPAVDGVTGSLGFDDRGDVDGRAVVVELKSGQVRFVSSVSGQQATPSLGPGTAD